MKLSIYKSTFYLLLISFSFVFNSCDKTEETSELVGTWLAAAPYQDGIYYRPNLIADITPDKMTIYEDVSNPTTFTWKQKGNIIYHENETHKDKLHIIDNQSDTLVVQIGRADTLQFIRLVEPQVTANENLISDVSIFDFLFSNTFEINIPTLDWQIRKVNFLEGGNFVTYKKELLEASESNNFELGNWELLVIRNHYFLFLNNLKSEKPLLIHLENLTDFKLSGQLAFTKNLHPIDLQAIINQNEITAATNELIIGDWNDSAFRFNTDSTFLEIANSDTLSGQWTVNTTNELILLTKNHKTLQFGFIDLDEKSIDMQYLTDFHNDYSSIVLNKE